MHQADDPRRHVAERGEAPLAGQPFVVREDDERRHERHEDQRGQPPSHRRQERGDPVDYASHPLADGTPSIRIAEAHSAQVQIYCRALAEVEVNQASTADQLVFSRKRHETERFAGKHATVSMPETERPARAARVNVHVMAVRPADRSEEHRGEIHPRHR